jgi:hypothetical protein
VIRLKSDCLPYDIGMSNSPNFHNIKAGEEFFLSQGGHSTMHFQRFSSENQNIYVQTKWTMDPDEDMDCEELTPDEAIAKYCAAYKDGFRNATGWHRDKAGHPWRD